jgi:transcription initiation factor TFIID subunit 13
VAHHARRAKVKVEDFKFVFRRDPVKLGRVVELLEMEKVLKRKRKAFETDEGAVTKGAKGKEEGEGAEGEEGKRKKRRKGEDGEKA